MEIPNSARAVLDGPGLAHLVTIEPDGRPQVSIVWVGLDGDELVAGHLPEHRKIRNMRRDPGVVLSVEAAPVTSSGSTSTWSFMDVPGLRRAGLRSCSSGLAHVYLGPEVKFPPMDDPPPGYITHISVDRIGGVGPWAR